MLGGQPLTDMVSSKQTCTARLYARSVLFHNRRVLSRSGLEWLRKITQDQLDEVGDSTEHGKRLKHLIAAVDYQLHPVGRWEE